MLESNVRLTKVGPVQLPLRWALEIDAGVEYNGGKTFVVRGAYNLVIIETPDDDDRPADENAFTDEAARVAKLTFTLAGLFELRTTGDDATLNADELEAYAATTGQFALYPYAREFVSDATTRLGLPPLTLAVWRMPS